MANSKISLLAAAGAMSDSDLFPIVQGGATKKGLLSALVTYLRTKITAPNAMPYSSGRYYLPDRSPNLPNAAGAVGVSGTLYMMPGSLRKAATIASFVANITTLAAGGNFQIAIYAADATTGLPTGAPLYTSASASTAATGAIETSTGATLAAGDYWFCLQRDNATVIFRSFVTTSLAPVQLVGASTGLLALGAGAAGWTKTGTFGTWPTLTGNQTTDGLTLATTAIVPMIAFKVS
ncbi:MAG TPA: hypothetical protein VGF77_08515 [Allosphingosinicella sp.]|jgi:hypothetical protein